MKFKNVNTLEFEELDRRLSDLSQAQQVDYLESSKTANSTNFAFHYTLGKRNFDLSNYSNAVKSLELALSLNADHLPSQRLLIEARSALSREYGDQVTAFEKDLQRRTCSKPFEHLEISDRGDVYLCCPSYLPASIGNIHSGQSLPEIWNSADAKEIRSSITDGSFRYCSRMHCPSIISRALPIKPENFHPPQAQIKQLLLSYDRSCNLACPTCRTDFIFQDGTSSESTLEEFEGTLEKIFPILAQVKELSLSGAGDPLASRHFSRLLTRLSIEKYPQLEILLRTNGLLFTEKWWDQNPNLRKFPLSAYVSIDAANSQTYSSVRKGGDFAKLMQNLDFMQKLRNQGILKKLVLLFVVQNENFREMEEFIQLGLKLKADRVTFTRLRNWGTFSPAEFKNRNVASPSHPKHSQLVRLLGHPNFRNEKVNLGDLAEILPRFTPSSASVVIWIEKVGLISSAKRVFAALPLPIRRLILRCVYQGNRRPKRIKLT